MSTRVGYEKPLPNRSRIDTTTYHQDVHSGAVWSPMVTQYFQHFPEIRWGFKSSRILWGFKTPESYGVPKAPESYGVPKAPESYGVSKAPESYGV